MIEKPTTRVQLELPAAKGSANEDGGRKQCRGHPQRAGERIVRPDWGQSASTPQLTAGPP